MTKYDEPPSTPLAASVFHELPIPPQPKFPAQLHFAIVQEDQADHCQTKRREVAAHGGHTALG